MIPAGYHTPVKKKRGSFVGGPIPFDNVPSKYTKRFFFANALGVVKMEASHNRECQYIPPTKEE